MESVALQPTEYIQAKADAMFDTLRIELYNLLPTATIHHIGSTAFGCPVTKGDVDICVRVAAGEFHAARELYNGIYPQNVGSYMSGTLQSYAFMRDGMDIGIQLVIIGSMDDHFVRFVDIMKLLPDLCVEYGNIKREHAGQGTTAYRAAKSAFIERVLSDRG